MKKLGFIVTLLLICTFVGFSTNSTTSSAKVSISKVRKQCSSYKKARKHMKKITFKVWDLKGSKKVTRTKSIYIHKSIASKVKKAFNKIYHGKEKFPIHDVGGFDWRGSNKSLHSLGLAVDINANENYMVDHGKVLAGSFWKPGKKPDSIKNTSHVKKYMKTIGFKQCIWGSRKDYMHFSVGGY